MASQKVVIGKILKKAIEYLEVENKPKDPVTEIISLLLNNNCLK